MCDYSLMMIDNRLAAEGEQLLAHRFNSGTTGMVSRFDFENWRTHRPVTLWQRLTECFWCSSEPRPVVCIPPGALLRLKNLPQNLRSQFGLSACEDAVFTQLSAEGNQHRDALQFENGTTMSLQLLPEGQTAIVLRLSSTEAISFDPELVQTA